MDDCKNELFTEKMYATKDSHLSELGQPQKDKYFLCSVIWSPNALYKCIKSCVGMWYENRNKTVKVHKEELWEARWLK